MLPQLRLRLDQNLLLIADDRLSFCQVIPANTVCEVKRQISWILKTSHAANPPTTAFPHLNISELSRGTAYVHLHP